MTGYSDENVPEDYDGGDNNDNDDDDDDGDNHTTPKQRPRRSKKNDQNISKRSRNFARDLLGFFTENLDWFKRDTDELEVMAKKRAEELGADIDDFKRGIVDDLEVHVAKQVNRLLKPSRLDDISFDQHWSINVAYHITGLAIGSAIMGLVMSMAFYFYTN